MATTATPTARFEARISAELHAMLKRAAEIQDRTMTDFVVSAASEAAERTIAQAEVMTLSMADQRAFANALISPPQLNATLTRAFERRRTLLRAQ
jgi:uncharacterized protein (DUF1778 family)